jgi:hypothetical protein
MATQSLLSNARTTCGANSSDGRWTQPARSTSSDGQIAITKTSRPSGQELLVPGGVEIRADLRSFDCGQQPVSCFMEIRECANVCAPGSCRLLSDQDPFNNRNNNRYLHTSP